MTVRIEVGPIHILSYSKPDGEAYLRASGSVTITIKQLELQETPPVTLEWRFKSVPGPGLEPILQRVLTGC